MLGIPWKLRPCRICRNCQHDSVMYCQSAAVAGILLFLSGVYVTPWKWPHFSCASPLFCHWNTEAHSKVLWSWIWNVCTMKYDPFWAISNAHAFCSVSFWRLQKGPLESPKCKTHTPYCGMSVHFEQCKGNDSLSVQWFWTKITFNLQNDSPKLSINLRGLQQHATTS